MDTNNDLTTHAPRSPNNRLGGYSILARALDKGRATIAGTPGEYHFDCPLDNMLFSFKGIKGDEIHTLLADKKNDDEVVSWLNAHGTPKTRAEITQWSLEVERNRPYNDSEKKEWFSTECKTLGLQPENTTLCQMLDEDDLKSFAVKSNQVRN